MNCLNRPSLIPDSIPPEVMQARNIGYPLAKHASLGLRGQIFPMQQ
jgi:hypothetical protein